ncbi:MAG: SDR family oxidoreductase [Dehalococcoidia bacterium]
MPNKIKAMKNRKVAITGGAGFIGANLAKELAANNSVIIIDNLSVGKKENVTDLLGENVKFVEGSIGDLSLLKRLFRNVDFVFHQAAISSVPKSIENPLATNETNVTGTLNVLLAARDSGVKKVIYASSAAVYGDTPTLPQKEELMPNPQSPYATTKLVGEHYCQAFQAVYGLPTVSLRYFNVYGPKQDPNSDYAAVIPRFIKRVSKGKSPIIFGDGEQTRDLVFVSDAVRANILAAESDATGVFNIGQGRRVTINELAKLIIHTMNKDVGIVYQAARVGDIRHSLADISKAKLIGYEPRYDLQSGLKETIRNL